MRDPKRIQPFCNRLARAWSIVPDLRFGQLMYIVMHKMSQQGCDPFYHEDDDEMIRFIEEYVVASVAAYKKD